MIRCKSHNANVVRLARNGWKLRKGTKPLVPNLKLSKDHARV